MKKIILATLFLLSIFLSFFLNIDKVNVPYFGGVYKNIGVDLTLKENSLPSVFLDGMKINKVLKIDDVYSYHYLFMQNKFHKVNKITFDDITNIKKIMIYNGNSIEFPAIQKEINTDNSKDILDYFSILILSFFYNPQIYIVSYILLFIYLIKYGFDFNKYSVFLIFILAFILRITSLNSIPFWDDEIYSIVHTSGSFWDAFSDLGNPPLYFILLKIFRVFFTGENLYRVSSVILGLIFNFVFYIWLKKILNKKMAIIGLILASVNIILIYFSQELRCYMLLMILSVLNAILLFNFKKKNTIYYFLCSVALLYTHFYGTFLFFYNFIFGLFYLSKKRIKKFAAINIASFVLFIPLLIYKKEGITSDFNSWISIPELKDYFFVFETFSGHFLIFFVFIIFAITLYFLIRKRRLKVFLIYNFCSILFTLITSISFSYLIKPIFLYRYFYVVYPMYLAIVTLLAGQKYKSRYGIIVSFFFIIVFGLNSRLNKQNLFCNHNLFLQYVKNDIDKNKNNFIFMADTVRGYKKFADIAKNTSAKLIYLPINKGMNDINPAENLKTPFVAYILNLYLKDEAIKKADKIDLYKTNVGVFLKVEYK